MKRLYRIEHNGGARYAVESDGAFRLVEGDIFDGPLHEGQAVTPPGFSPPWCRRKWLPSG